jgi:hypothetical protein
MQSNKNTDSIDKTNDKKINSDLFNSDIKYKSIDDFSFSSFLLNSYDTHTNTTSYDSICNYFFNEEKEYILKEIEEEDDYYYNFNNNKGINEEFFNNENTNLYDNYNDIEENNNNYYYRNFSYSTFINCNSEDILKKEKAKIEEIENNFKLTNKLKNKVKENKKKENEVEVIIEKEFENNFLYNNLDFNYKKDEFLNYNSNNILLKYSENILNDGESKFNNNNNNLSENLFKKICNCSEIITPEYINLNNKKTEEINNDNLIENKEKNENFFSEKRNLKNDDYTVKIRRKGKNIEKKDNVRNVYKYNYNTVENKEKNSFDVFKHKKYSRFIFHNLIF